MTNHEYLLQKRDRLLDELRSDEHYDRVESVAYGDHDPFQVPIARCETCGKKPQLHKLDADNTKRRWLVVCRKCRKRAKHEARTPWQAILEWNGINLASQDYRELPLFGLGRLAPTEAHKRLSGIRRNIELRKKIAGLERQLSRLGLCRSPGERYMQRMKAYLAWCMLGLRLTRHAIREAA